MKVVLSTHQRHLLTNKMRNIYHRLVLHPAIKERRILISSSRPKNMIKRGPHLSSSSMGVDTRLSNSMVRPYKSSIFSQVADRSSATL